MKSEKSPSIYECALCGDTGYIPELRGSCSYVKPCKCLFRKAKAKHFGELFKDKTIENYEARSDSMQKAKEAILKSPDSSFYIYGNVGLGKTHLLAGIYELTYDTNEWVYCKIYTESELSKLLESREHPDILSKGYTRIVFLDDIGKIKLLEWQIEKMFTFYNDIYRFNIQLIVSSNYSLEDLAKYYGGAITRRIEENTTILQIKEENTKLFEENQQDQQTPA